MRRRFRWMRGFGAAADERGDRRPAEALLGVHVAHDGLRPTLERSTFAAAAFDEPFSYRITDAQGQPVRDFEVQHARRMYFIVARRDPRQLPAPASSMKSDGTWTTRVDFGEAGTYRVFADFSRAWRAAHGEGG